MEAFADAERPAAARTQIIEQLATVRQNMNNVLHSVENSLISYEENMLALQNESVKCSNENARLRSENAGLHMQLASGKATTAPGDVIENHRMRAGVQDHLEIVDFEADGCSHHKDRVRRSKEKVCFQSETTELQFTGGKTAVDRTSDTWCTKVQSFAPEALHACVVEPVWSPPHIPSLEEEGLEVLKAESASTVVSQDSCHFAKRSRLTVPRNRQEKPPLMKSHTARWRAIQDFSSGPNRRDSLSSLRSIPLNDMTHKGSPRMGKTLSTAIVARQLPVFADAMAMKEKVREALAEKEYDVTDLYRTSGLAQMIARSTLFEYTSLLVIFINAIWISVEVDNNDKQLLSDADWQYQLAEHLFCSYFVVEWGIRFCAFERKRNSLSDAWFCFDTLLVVIMILETWVMTLVASSTGLSSVSVLKLIRLVRLLRISRLARLVRRIPELVILFKGIYVATRSVFFVFALLMIIIYVVAIVMRELTNDTEIGRQYFKSVPESMSSLLLEGVLPDQARWIQDCGDSNVFLGLLCLVFVLLASLLVLQMLTGILVSVVQVVSTVEKEQLQVTYVKQKLMSLLGRGIIDCDHSQSISKDEFRGLLTNRDAAVTIKEVGVDVVGLVDFAEIIFGDDVELSFHDFIDFVLQLRGTNTCTVKDIVDLRKFLVGEMQLVQENIGKSMNDLYDSFSDVIGGAGRKRHVRAFVSKG